MAGSDFSRKLELVLKALTLSRGRLASELGVDKSLVGRWVSGSVRPSAHNLAGLTALIATRKAGFTLIDWDRDLVGLADLFGVDAAILGARPASISPVSPGFTLGFRADAMHAREIEETGHIYEGFYAHFHKSVTMSDGRPILLIHMLWQENGRLRGKHGAAWLTVEEEVMILRNKLWIVGESTDGKTGLLYSIFNGAGPQRAMVMDGIAVGAASDRSMTLTASRHLLIRVADLSGDLDADHRRFAAMAARINGPERWELSARLLPAEFAHVIDNRQGLHGPNASDHAMRIDPERSVSISDMESGDFHFRSPELCAFFAVDS